MLNTIRMQLLPALVITRREVRDQFRDWRIIFPIVALTIFFPGLMNFTAAQAVSFVERYGAPIIATRLIPFLLMIVGFFPISISLVIALESFVGEKERYSIEPLLSSPLSDGQLYVGKLFAAMVPPLLASYLGIIVYLVGIYLQIGWQPEPGLLIQIILLTTVQALVMVSGAVVVSTQTTSVRAANLLASFIIIPMAILIQGESIIMFWGRYNGLWWAIIGQVVIAGLLIRSGLAHFNREELLGRELDILNFGWGWRTFWQSFKGDNHSLVNWYRNAVMPALRSVLIPLGILTLAAAAALWIGIYYAGILVIPPDLLVIDKLGPELFTGSTAVKLFETAGIGTVWLHNLRVLAIASFLGIFSFGVLAVIVIMIPIVLIGYLMTSMAAAGMSPFTFLAAFVLPHGILEIPAIIVGGAVILHLGATLAIPGHGRTIGEAWLISLADWAKVFIGVVIPLLLGAAVLEVLVTPRIVLLLLGGS